MDTFAEAELVDAFERFPTAIVSDALDELGLTGAIPNLVSRQEAARIAGRAFTAYFAPRAADPSAYRYGGGVGRPLEQVLRRMQAGQVVVIDLGGALTAAAWGGLASRIALARGVRGTVVSGCCRDIDEIRAHAYPVWTTGVYPRRSRNEFTFGSIGEPLIVHGVHVNPGDLILADPSGVVRVPQGSERDVLEIAEQIAKTELALAAQAATDSVANWDQI